MTVKPLLTPGALTQDTSQAAGPLVEAWALLFAAGVQAVADTSSPGPVDFELAGDRDRDGDDDGVAAVMLRGPWVSKGGRGVSGVSGFVYDLVDVGKTIFGNRFFCLCMWMRAQFIVVVRLVSSAGWLHAPLHCSISGRSMQ